MPGKPKVQNSGREAADCVGRTEERQRTISQTLMVTADQQGMSSGGVVHVQIQARSFTISLPTVANDTMLTTVTFGRDVMKPARSIVLSMRLPVESGKRLKRIANRHGWTPSDASARLVEEGLRRSEFAFLDFRDSPAGRQAYIQGSTLAIWEVMLLLRSYKGNVKDVAKHLNWPEAKVRAALNYSEAFPEEVNEAIAENDATDFDSLRRMLPQAVDFAATKIKRG
jgi:hypothetical protein